MSASSNHEEHRLLAGGGPRNNATIVQQSKGYKSSRLAIIPIFYCCADNDTRHTRHDNNSDYDMDTGANL